MPEQFTIMGGKVHVYKRPNSSHWQCSTYFAGKNRRSSTKQESLSKEKERAEDWYLQLRGKLRSGEIKAEKTFREASELFLREYDIITQGQRSKVYVQGQQRRSQRHLVPFFGHLGLPELSASELVEKADIPDRFQQVVILYLETYEARVSDVYRTLRHKVIALAHFWRFIRDRHPDVKRCSQILPRHVRDYIPHVIARARAVQRGPGAGDEVRPTAHSWLVDLRVFFSDLCAWATEPDSPFKRFAPRTIPATRHTFLGYGFEKARERTRARITATVLDLEREMPKDSRLRSSTMESCARGAQSRNDARLPVVRRGGHVLGLGSLGAARTERVAHRRGERTDHARHSQTEDARRSHLLLAAHQAVEV